MIARHTLKVTALCPKGGRDHYTAEIEVDQFVPVEGILSVAEKFSNTAIYQEDLVVSLACELKAKVTLTGLHGQVHTVVEATPAFGIPTHVGQKMLAG